MKRIGLRVTLILVSLSLLASVCYSHGEREDKEELILKALDIIYGKVVDIQYRRLEEIPYEITTVKVHVIEQFKGEPKEEIILKFQGGKTVTTGFHISLKEGDEAIFFTYKPVEEWLTTIYEEPGLMVTDGVIKGFNMTIGQFKNFADDLLK